MRRRMMKSKVHRATVTASDLNYTGSITMDQDLLDRADIADNEQVHVLDVDNGNRFETYAITGDRGSGVVCLNGAAARMVQPGDKIIVITYADYDEAELADYEARVVHVDAENRPLLAGVGVPTDAAPSVEVVPEPAAVDGELDPAG